MLLGENLVKPFFGWGKTDPAVVAAGEEKFHKAAKVLDGWLQGRKWVAGDTLTLADFAVGRAAEPH